jgi:hypothetical protein
VALKAIICPTSIRHLHAGMSIATLRADRRLFHRLIGDVRTQTDIRQLPAMAIADAR